MKSVKNRKELINGIKAGERHFNIESKTLLMQCQLASKFNYLSDYSNNIVANMAASLFTGWQIVAIIGIVVAGAIAIIAILKQRGLTIEIRDSNGNSGRVEIK
ncbi:MAG: hypothetical protein K2L22_08135 [Muribaculaceae bacterium]|nr:hypothetical protein [Muribaculaceae bacterium]